MQSSDSDQPQFQPSVYSREEHCISRKNIDEDALKIMYRLIRYRFKAFLVGGGVRDLLLGKKPKDFDIGTDATPKQCKSLFSNCRIIGRRFKLAHIYFRAGKIIEVSTFRDFTAPIDTDDDKEAETLEARTLKDNKFGTPQTDALRRDLTINGLFYDLSSFSVIDYVGGMNDLKSGIIRVIGDPSQRYIEDPVRMLRTVRHAARTGFVIDARAEQAIRQHAALIRQCATVRVYEELKKDLSSGFCTSILTLLGRYGLLEQLLPELCTEHGSLLEHESPLKSALTRLDEAILAGKTFGTSTILALIALYSLLDKDQSGADWIELLYEGDNLKESLASRFAKLAVPKKEKAKISEMFAAIKRSLKLDPRRVAGMNFGKNVSPQDLKGLLELLEFTPEIEPLLSALSRPIKRSPSRHSRGGRGNYRPRRANRQRFFPKRSARMRPDFGV